MTLISRGSCLLLMAAACSACGDDAKLKELPTVADLDAGTDAATPLALKQPKAELFPSATGDCPAFEEGMGCTRDDISLICTMKPAGIVPRPVRVWVSERAGTAHGPLIVFWHGLSRTASDAPVARAGLGPDVLASILDQGGVLFSPERSEKRQTADISMLPWLLATGSGEEDDLLVLDEIVACADKALHIDRRRIHITGMSAGGLQTGQVGSRRSGYVASTAVFSGGQLGSVDEQDPENLYSAILFHGGPNDMVVLNFKTLQTTYFDKLKARGQFAVLCDHGSGHSVPPEAASAAWRFLDDHPFGVSPEPYAGGLPTELPAYCSP
jgi:hypothetical protein